MLEMKRTNISSIYKGTSDSKDRSRSLDTDASHNPLSTVLPLDWLFSDSEPEPPGSPKHLSSKSSKGKKEAKRVVNEEDEDAITSDVCHQSSSHGSSGTDTETKQLLSHPDSELLKKNEKSGAIPKKRQKKPSAPLENIEGMGEEDEEGDEDDIDDGSESSQPFRRRKDAFQGHNRRAFRWRKGERQSEEMMTSQEGDEESADEIDLKKRILEILSAPDNDECERELAKLKKELKNMKRKQATTAAIENVSGDTSDKYKIEGPLGNVFII